MNYRQGLWILIASTVGLLLLTFGGRFIVGAWHAHRARDPTTHIQAIIQTGPSREQLKTSYLAELMGLSLDHPQSLVTFDLNKAEARLKQCPLISEVTVEKLPPHTLYIDYTVRTPLARLGDYDNVALDRSGALFPLTPFLTPKDLPEFYLGLPPFLECASWQRPLHDRGFTLALKIYDFLASLSWREGFRVKRIDVSNAWAPSLGHREIVLFLDDDLLLNLTHHHLIAHFPKILRLPGKHWEGQLNSFLVLRRQMAQDYERQLRAHPPKSREVSFAPRTIDLRIQKIAYVENN